MGIALDRVVRQDWLKMLQRCTCISCHKLIDPLGARQAPCTHILCSSCISCSVADSMLLCPKDNKPVKGEKLQPFKDANPMMYDMLNNSVDVKCVRFNEGCPWQGKLSDVANHETACSGVTHCKCCDNSQERCAELEEQARASAAGWEEEMQTRLAHAERLSSEAAERARHDAAIAASSLRQQLDLAHMDNEQLRERMDSQEAEAIVSIQDLREQLEAKNERCTALEHQSGTQELAEEQLQQWQVHASELKVENEELKSRLEDYLDIVSTFEEEISSLKKKLSLIPSTPRSRENGTSLISEIAPMTPPIRGSAPADAASSSNGPLSRDPSSGLPRNLRTGPSKNSPVPPPRLEVPARPHFVPLQTPSHNARGIGRSNGEGFAVTEGQQSDGSRRPTPINNPITSTCLRDLKGHTSPVTALAVSGRNVVSASDDRSIKMWNRNKLVGEIQGAARSWLATSKDTGHTDTVTALCCGPNHVLYSASADRTIKAWSERKCQATLKGHKGSVLALAVSSHNVLFSGGNDMTIRQWENWACTVVLRKHTRPVTALAIAADGLLWSGDAGGNVKGWQNAVPFREFIAHQGSITGLAFDPRGTLWTASSLEATVKGWNSEGCVVVLDGHQDGVTALAVEQDAKARYATVWSGSHDGTVRGHRWDGGEATCFVKCTQTSHVTALAVGLDGTVWSGGDDNNIKEWQPLGQGAPPAPLSSPGAR